MLLQASAAVLAASLVGLSSSGWRRGQQPKSAVGSPVDLGCANATKWAETHATEARLFGATSSGDGYEPKDSLWREYASQLALEEAGAGGTLFYVASVWTLPSGDIFVHTQQSSFSGDWGLYVDYCFRQSGVVAKIAWELRVLPSHAITRRAIDWDVQGRETARRTTRYDLHTKAELDRGAGEGSTEIRDRPDAAVQTSLGLAVLQGVHEAEMTEQLWGNPGPTPRSTRLRLVPACTGAGERAGWRDNRRMRIWTDGRN